jgi:hypothetical protein
MVTDSFKAKEVFIPRGTPAKVVPKVVRAPAKYADLLKSIAAQMKQFKGV